MPMSRPKGIGAEQRNSVIGSYQKRYDLTNIIDKSEKQEQIL